MKFNDVSLESDTALIAAFEANIEEYDVLYQKWLGNGFYGESFIFASSDVTSLSDDDLIELAKSSPMVNQGSYVTLKRGEDYVFLNFNFICADDA